MKTEKHSNFIQKLELIKVMQWNVATRVFSPSQN